MTREQLDAIRARVEAATQGPWEAVTPKRFAAVRSDAERCYVYTQGKIPADTHPDTVARQQRDAQFIAAARQDVPALLAEVERLTAELHRMKSRPAEAEFSRLDTMWQQLVRERDEAVHELWRLKGDRSEVNTAKLNDAFTEGTLKAGDAMRPLIAAAFRRGVVAMREAAAKQVVAYSIKVVDPLGRVFPVSGETLETLANAVRSLPDPEDTP